MLRGNHECSSINRYPPPSSLIFDLSSTSPYQTRGTLEYPLKHCHARRIYGFYDECKKRYSLKLWKAFNMVFNCLPIAAIVDDKIFCIHGGLSPDLNSMEQIRRILRPTGGIPFETKPTPERWLPDVPFGYDFGKESLTALPICAS